MFIPELTWRGKVNGVTRFSFPILLLLLVPLLAVASDSYERIDFARLTAMIDAGGPLLVVDTRAEEPYAAGHIPTAVNLPGYQFDKAEPAGLPANRDLPIVTYCNGGHCGIGFYVAERLLDFGYSRVYVYEEGVDGWKKRGQELVGTKQEQVPRITQPDLAALLATGANLRLIDARPAAEFAGRTLPKAVNLTLAACKPGAPNWPPAADETIVVFGQGPWDGRPYRVADCLRAWGRRDVRVFAAGLNGWLAK